MRTSRPKQPPPQQLDGSVLQAADAWEALNKELVAMMDAFANLVRASRIPDDDADQLAIRDGGRARDRTPGDLLEVWADKFVASGHSTLRHVASLKSRALPNDFRTLLQRGREVRATLARHDGQLVAQLSALKTDMQDMVGELENSFYGCPHRGRPVEPEGSEDLKELVAIAMEMRETAAPPGSGDPE